jgi:hypothetical protein
MRVEPGADTGLQTVERATHARGFHGKNALVRAA